MKLRLWLIALALLAIVSQPAAAEPTTIYNVTIVDVADGTPTPQQSITFDGDRISAIGATSLSGPGRRIDGTGLFVLPGLWDMHVHSHRERRWTYHYPLFRAFGITGVREAGTHLGSALALREQSKANPLAPRVVWGTPIVDGAPQVNSFGLSAEDEASGRQLVQQLHRLGFDFLKVYDRLTPEAYLGLTSEARRLGMPIEGHVPLALSPDIAIASGQRLIDHLTLIAESCSPQSLDVVGRENARNPGESDSLSVLNSDQVIAAMAQFDVRTCRPLFDRLARQRIWQVPTYVQLEGMANAGSPPAVWPARTEYVSPPLRSDWEASAKKADPAELADTRRMLDIQLSMLKPMADAGVPILAGTDTSNEIWVFAGYSLHRELELFVEAGLTPLQAMQTATLNPLLYAGNERANPIAIGKRADLVLFAADPTADIANLATIRAVVARGMYHDQASLDALLADAKLQAKTAGK